MKHLTKSFLAAGALMYCMAASAGTQVLGFELNVSTLDQVKETLATKTTLTQKGISEISNGPMFESDGASFDIEGLKSVRYMFDEKNKLVFVHMIMNKDRFKTVFNTLSAKYKITSDKRPFVGDQYVLFKSKDAVIELTAPHLGFEAAVGYFRNDIYQKAMASFLAESKAKQKREASQF